MIEELAKAIWNTREARFPAYTRRKPDQLDEATGAFQNCREEAIAVLRRLREPTPEMFEAGAAFLDATRSRHGSWPVAGIVEGLYRTMIDAAMKKEPG